MYLLVAVLKKKENVGVSLEDLDCMDFRNFVLKRLNSCNVVVSCYI